MRHALAAAAEPPRAIAEAAGELAQVADAAAAAGKEPMRADAAVAATLARGAAAAALQVVAANLAGVPAGGAAPASS
jgi:formiminotetrahydrofolate cyclodeaminase